MKNLTLPEIKAQLNTHSYIAGDTIHYAIFASLATNKPLYIDGPPGVGKTEIAKVLSRMLNAQLIRPWFIRAADIVKTFKNVEL